jgi:uncharacterized membrane protein YuzA (DUF378 family)
MDFLRWLALEKYREFATEGVFVPLAIVNAMLLAVFSIVFLAIIGGPIAVTIWAILFLITVGFWGLYAFLFAQEWYRARHKEFETDTTKP